MKKLLLMLTLILSSNSFVVAQDCSGMTDYPDLIEVCNAESQFFPDAAEILFPVDFFNCFADPEIDNGDGTVTVVAFDVFNSLTGNYIGSLYESPTLGRVACLDLTIVVPLNETCDPIEYQFEIVTSVNIIDIASNTTLSSTVDPNCGIETMTGILYPVLTASATDAECPNDITATLTAENGTVCLTETQTCIGEGPVNFDFSGSVTDLLGCSTLTSTASCTNCGPPCIISASTISTTDPTRICIDGVADPINVNIDTDGGGTGAWVITDAAGIILALPTGPPFDLDDAGAGQCLIWYVNFDDVNFAPAVGDDAAAIVAASTCAFLSNAITIDRIEVTGATIVLPNNGTSVTICIDSDTETPIPVSIFANGIGPNDVWVITDSNGIILDLPADPSAIILDGAGVGTCQIWLVTYDDVNFAPVVGDDAATIVAAATCAALSNPITVDRENCNTPCGLTMASTISTTDPTRICVDGVGDPINVTIDTDAGGTGVWVITDAAGIILAFPPGPPFDLDGAGAGQCLIWYVNTEDENFNPMVGDDAAIAIAASDCTFLSNAIVVDRVEVTSPQIESSQGGIIVRICIDGVADLIDVNIIDPGIGTNSAWVITDTNADILALPAGPPFDLDSAGPGECLIWYVNYDDPNFVPAVGDNAAALVNGATCASLSNPISVERIEVTAATISTTNPLTICVDDGVDEPIDVTINDVGIGANGAWVITDATGTIVALPATPPFVLDGAGVGTCSIWWVNYDDPAFAPAVGDDAASIVAVATCAVLSNPIIVERENCGSCEDTIQGSVTTEETGCSPAGIEVTIYDSSGAIVATVTTDATGNYALMGLYPCGSYSAELTANVPDCYVNSGGSTGPISFDVDGDGTPDGVNFTENPQVPALSEWGLITLALLLMIIGSLKMSATQVILKRT